MAICSISQKKTLKPIKAKMCTMDYAGGATKRAKVHNDQLRVAAPSMAEIVSWPILFSGEFSGKRTADPKRSNPTYYISIDEVSAEKMPFGGLIDTHHPIAELSPKNSSFWGRQWGFPA
jgi:hypothetical protein